MKDLTFNEWQENLSKQLEKDYQKLKLVKVKKSVRQSLIIKNKV